MSQKKHSGKASAVQKTRERLDRAAAADGRAQAQQQAKEADARKPKCCEWLTSTELEVAHVAPEEGVLHYNKYYMSEIWRNTPFGHWGGWDTKSAAPGVLLDQSHPLSPKLAAEYRLARTLAENEHITQEITGLFTLQLEALSLVCTSYNESIRLQLRDRTGKEQPIAWFLPRLAFHLLLPRYMSEQYLSVVRFPFYCSLYDELDYSHPLVARTPVLTAMRQRPTSPASSGGFTGVPIEIMREIMCRLTPHDLCNFALASRWGHRVAMDDDVWCWQVATHINLDVVPLLMKRLSMEFRRLWILLNNAVTVTFEKAADHRATKYRTPYSHFIVDFHIGPLRSVVRSPFPSRMFAPERSKE